MPTAIKIDRALLATLHNCAHRHCSSLKRILPAVPDPLHLFSNNMSQPAQAHDRGPDGGDTDSNQLGGSRTTVAAEAPWEREVSRDTVHLPDLSQSVEVSRAPANWQPTDVFRQQRHQPQQQQSGAAAPQRPLQQSQGGSNMQWPRVLPPSQAPPGVEPGSRKVALVYDDGTIEVVPAFDAGPRHSGAAATQQPAAQQQQQQPSAGGSAAVETAAVSNQDSIPLPDAPSTSPAAEPAASEGSDASESRPQAMVDAAASDGAAAETGNSSPHARGAGNVSGVSTCPISTPAAPTAAGAGPSGVQQQEALTHPQLGAAAAANCAPMQSDMPSELQQHAQPSAPTMSAQQEARPAGSPSQLPATPQQRPQPPASSASGNSTPVAWVDTPSQQSQQMRAPPGLTPDPPTPKRSRGQIYYGNATQLPGTAQAGFTFEGSPVPWVRWAKPGDIGMCCSLCGVPFQLQDAIHRFCSCGLRSWPRHRSDCDAARDPNRRDIRHAACTLQAAGFTPAAQGAGPSSQPATPPQALAAAGAPNIPPPAPHKPTGVRPPYAAGPAAAAQAAGQQQPHQWPPQLQQPPRQPQQQVPPHNWQQPGPLQRRAPQQWQQQIQPQQQPPPPQQQQPSQQRQQQSHALQAVSVSQQPPGQSTPYNAQRWQQPGVSGAGSDGGDQQLGGIASGAGATVGRGRSRRPDADDADPPAKRRLSF